MVKVEHRKLGYKALLLALLIGAAGIGPAAQAADNPDPWEKMNRVTHQFNDVADRVVLKPLARGYQKITPDPVEQSVGNFFSNLLEVRNIVNNLLQGKLLDALSDTGRLVINTTLGAGGLFDPAQSLGLEKHNEDFGQTLRTWGVPQGPYLVLPFLGPSTLTDAIGRPANSYLDPVRYLHPVDHRNVLMGVEIIDQRAGLLSAESVVFGDQYIFFRDAYLQRRDYLAKDGEVVDDFDDF
ncbi:MAG: VacJ family lipoprotein [Pseudomonadales bacterium]|nr:VacJ family lipoprotein [Pseudomonadales bacterium]